MTARSLAGLTTRVLKDPGRSTGNEARVILGAAVIDDVPGLVMRASRLRGAGILLALALAFCFLLSLAAALAGLAPIVGAFAAGRVPVFFVQMIPPWSSWSSSRRWCPLMHVLRQCEFDTRVTDGCIIR